MEGGQGDHLACHILADLFLEFGNWKLKDDIFSSYMFHVQEFNMQKLLYVVKCNSFQSDSSLIVWREVRCGNSWFIKLLMNP